MTQVVENLSYGTQRPYMVITKTDYALAIVISSHYQHY